MHNSNPSFYKYHNINKNLITSFKSKYSLMAEFVNDLETIFRLDPKKEHTKPRKIDVYNAASELNNGLLEIFFNEYYDFFRY